MHRFFSLHRLFSRTSVNQLIGFLQQFTGIRLFPDIALRKHRMQNIPVSNGGGDFTGREGMDGNFTNTHSSTLISSTDNRHFTGINPLI